MKRYNLKTLATECGVSYMTARRCVRENREDLARLGYEPGKTRLISVDAEILLRIKLGALSVHKRP